MTNETKYEMRILYPTGEFSQNVMGEEFDPNVSLATALGHIKDRMIVSGQRIVTAPQGFDVAIFDEEGVPKDHLGLEDLASRKYNEFCRVKEKDIFGEIESWGSVYLMLIPRESKKIGGSTTIFA